MSRYIAVDGLEMACSDVKQPTPHDACRFYSLREERTGSVRRSAQNHWTQLSVTNVLGNLLMPTPKPVQTSPLTCDAYAGRLAWSESSAVLDFFFTWRCFSMRGHPFEYADLIFVMLFCIGRFHSHNAVT